MQITSLVCCGYCGCSAGHVHYQQKTTPSHCTHLRVLRGRNFGLWPASALERADVLIHCSKQSQLQLCLGIGREEFCLGFCPNKIIK